LLLVDRFRIPNPPRTPTHFAIRSLNLERIDRQDSSGTTAISRAKVGDNLGAIAGCFFDIDADLGDDIAEDSEPDYGASMRAQRSRGTAIRGMVGRLWLRSRVQQGGDLVACTAAAG
jgi:hypothetical protein